MTPRIGLSNWLTIVALAIAAVVWAVRLEGRQDAQDRELATLKQVHKDTLEQVRQDLQYIRTRLDAALDAGLHR